MAEFLDGINLVLAIRIKMYFTEGINIKLIQTKHSNIQVGCRGIENSKMTNIFQFDIWHI